jgi:PAS domain S-box-containing protein
MRDARLSPFATSGIGAWLWASDASRVIWANASGAAVLGAETPAALTEKRFDPQEPAAQDIARLAASLPATGAARLERVRGTGSNLVSTCSRISLSGDTFGILVIAAEPARPSLPLAERVARLFAPASEAAAAFSPDGKLIYATGTLEPDTTLATFGAEALKDSAIAHGKASGDTALGPLTLERLGGGGSMVLVARLPDDVHESAVASSEDVIEHAASVEVSPDAAASSPESSDIAEPPALAESKDAAEPAPPEDHALTELADSLAAASNASTDEPRASESGEPAAQPERRAPLRFVWTMDATLHFTLASPEFADRMGPRTVAVIGRPWRQIAEALSLDPEGRVAKAIESHDTWSGITLSWPVDPSGETAPVELSGLPIFDRDRSFLGYRGFGVCRDLAFTTPRPPQSSTPHLVHDAPAPEPTHQETESTPESAPEPRPLLTVVPAVKNVVPFRGTAPAEKRPALTPVERSAFHEIGETLTNGDTPATATDAAAPEPQASAAEPAREPEPASSTTLPSAFATAAAPQSTEPPDHAVLERLPVGVLIHRRDELLYANRAFLEWTGYGDLAAVAADGGLERLVVEPGAGALDKINGTGKTFTIATRTGETLSCEGRLYTVPWNGESALMLTLIRTAAADRLRDAEIALRAADAEAQELKAILDTATDGVVVVDRDGLVLTFNRAAEALFGYEYHQMARRPFTALFAPESERVAHDYLDTLVRNGVASVLNDGREVIGRVRQGGLIPLFMTMGPIGTGMPKFCAVLRDLTQWKRAEEDLLNAKRAAERASSAKSEFLAKISHEIRTPLNAIIGFSEVMMQQQFGPIGNDRYRQYLNDIHGSGEHLVSLINDLLDLSKIEAGKLDMVFANVNLNQLVQQCVALMQPQANQQRIIIRSSLSQTLPPVEADARSVRQIVLNLLSNSIKFTGAGGQVIISTALTDRGDAVLRVRDTGAGMTDKEIETAMEPFRQLATSTRWGSGGTGLGLPLTKALAEANRASFTIKSAVDTGTLVEIAFPGTRVAAE